jgi:uncharacterized integral membrane protein
MSALIWFLRGTLFIIFLGLAIKNSADVELRFFFDASWQAPLFLVVLSAVAAGVVLGLLALLPQLIRQRRRIGSLQRQHERDAAELVAKVPPPSPTAL